MRWGPPSTRCFPRTLQPSLPLVPAGPGGEARAPEGQEAALGPAHSCAPAGDTPLQISPGVPGPRGRLCLMSKTNKEPRPARPSFPSSPGAQGSHLPKDPFVCQSRCQGCPLCLPKSFLDSRAELLLQPSPLSMQKSNIEIPFAPLPETSK